MNSLRDSCRSIEELDLGANKLTDLIEVYKILMLTPNLRFLNLSENDLSRTSPVACATANSAITSTNNAFNDHLHHQHLSGHTSALPSLQSASAHAPYSFATVAPPSLSQNYATRSRSTLGQANTTSSLRRRTIQQNINGHTSASSGSSSLCTNQSNATSHTSKSKAIEVRRLAAATAALAQSKKTCSRAAAATVSAAQAKSQVSSAIARRTTRGTCSQAAICSDESGNSTVKASSPNNSTQQQTSQASARGLMRRQLSTLHLARSLSSLTAVDTRSVRNTTTGPMQVASSSSSRRQSNSHSIRQHQQATLHHQQQQSASNYYYRRTFDSIKALALNNTRCQWKTVCSILTRMPNLEELHLSLNNYEKIDFEPSDFKHVNLKRLYLCNNPKLTDWEELNKLLIAFPCLEALSLADCAISQIPENLDTAREWQKICGLNITGWPIKEWPIIERLNALPSLIDLRCRNLQVLNEINEPRHHLIARLPKLQRLNGSEIEERDLAEKEFLRFFMTHSHLERPDRFHELVQIHGQDVAMPVVDVDVDLSPPNTASVRIVYLNKNYYTSNATTNDDLLLSEHFLSEIMQITETKFTSDKVENQENSPLVQSLHKDDCKEVLAASVDLRQSVRKFKTNLCQMFRLQVDSTNDLFLYYIDHEMVGLMGPELMKHNQKKLWNYNVQDGDQFIVEKR